MAWYPLLTLVVLLEILHTICCVSENDSFNLFRPGFRKNTNLNHTLEDKKFLFQTNEEPSEGKIIEKRRLFFNNGEMQSPSFNGENMEFSTRKGTNYSETEIENQKSEFQHGYNSWKDGPNGFPLPTGNAHSGNLQELHVKQPSAGKINQNFNWEQKSDVLEKTHSRWNENKNFKHFANPDFNPRLDMTNRGRPLQLTSDHGRNFNIYPGRDGDFFNRMSMTALTNPESVPVQNFNDDRVDEINSEYLGHSNINYYNRNPKALWNPNYYRPEKEVIINFNTECPAPREFNNQLVHKFTLTPKSSLTTQSEISTFSIPETAIISAHKMTPMYYL